MIEGYYTLGLTGMPMVCAGFRDLVWNDALAPMIGRWRARSKYREVFVRHGIPREDWKALTALVNREGSPNAEVIERCKWRPEYREALEEIWDRELWSTQERLASIGR